MIQLTHAAIDPAALLESVSDNQAGAVLLFLGTVREFTAGEQTSHLNYMAYESMAQSSLLQLEQEAAEQYDIVRIGIVHRLGELSLGEVSVAIAVSSAHRATAYECSRWLIDTLKQRIPIWKQEHYTDGRVEWQHPGMDPNAVAGSLPGLNQAADALHSNLPKEQA